MSDIKIEVMHELGKCRVTTRISNDTGRLLASCIQPLADAMATADVVATLVLAKQDEDQSCGLPLAKC